ncbi:LysM peptidoglycan-binding domain-containing protein [Bergeyella porcorum]|uniref:LysM peptidoglycan-binding domain-containing protein n=1 Tax=Bergeyella porcorum TaxID=1735111 RepID=UPI0035EF9D3D
MIKRILVLSALAMFSGINAQKSHTVTKGDTLYNIAKKYGMSLEQLTKLNPKIKDNKVNIGDVLIVNGKAAASSATPAETSSEIGYITLQPKQTIYGITKQYQITEAKLRALNPNLDGNMKIGNKIALPLSNIQKYGDKNAVVEVAETPVATTVVATQAIDENTYQIQPKDNYYQITKKFKITKEQLFALNPGLEQKGLQVGDVIRIKGDVAPPVSNTNSKPATATHSSNDEYATYTVKEGDTIFGIINRYGVSLDDLLALNPQLSNGLKVGMVLKLKKLDAAYVKKSGDALNVVLMLPFGFDANDTKFRSMSTDFLAGAQLAFERNAAAGLKLNVNIVDAKNEANFKSSLTQISKDNTDLIIGPFLKSNVVEVIDYVGSKKIPVVAPFANSEDLYGYDNLIIVETADDVYVDKIVEEIAKVYSSQKIYILSDANKANANGIKEGIEKRLKGANVVMVNSASEIKTEQNMMTGQAAPVVAVLASKDDALGAAFTNRLLELSKEVSNLKSFSMYYHPSFEKKQDDLFAANLVYLMDRKINTSGSFEKEVLAAYNEKYCKSPSKYAIIGFDVVNDILSRENKSGEVFKQIAKVQTQLATKFEYVRAKKNGAYINTGHRVVRLTSQ